MAARKQQQFTPKYRYGDKFVDEKTTHALDRHKHYLQHATVQKRLGDSMHPALRAQFDVTRYINSTISTIGRSSEAIWKCAPESVFKCVLQAALYGIELSSGPMVQGYLVPYKSECQLIVSWQGFLAVARRSGEVVDIKARCVYKDDHVDYQEGFETVFVHKPNIFATQRDEDIVAAYCITVYRDGHKSVDIMPLSQILKRRDHSPSWRNRATAKEPVPWEKWFPEMCLKTVIKSAAKAWPRTKDLERVLAHEAEQSGETEEFRPDVFESEEPLAKEQAIEAAEEPAKPDLGSEELRAFITGCDMVENEDQLNTMREQVAAFEGAELTAAQQAFETAKARLAPPESGQAGWKARRRAERSAEVG